MTDRPADAAPPRRFRCYECETSLTLEEVFNHMCQVAPPEREAAPPKRCPRCLHVNHSGRCGKVESTLTARWNCACTNEEPPVPREAAKPLFHDRAEALRQEKVKELASLGERRKRAEAAFWREAESMDPSEFATYDGAGKALKALWNTLDGQGG